MIVTTIVTWIHILSLLKRSVWLGTSTPSAVGIRHRHPGTKKHMVSGCILSHSVI